MEMVRVGGDQLGAADAWWERVEAGGVAGDVAPVADADGAADGGGVGGGEEGLNGCGRRLGLLVGGCGWVGLC